MGHNPRYQTWSSAQWMNRAGTVAELQVQGWPVVARCLTCRLEMDVRLTVLLKARGPDFSLWGRSARCRSRRCQGRMYFWTFPPQAKGKAVEMF